MKTSSKIFIYTSAYDINLNSTLVGVKVDQWEEKSEYTIYYSSKKNSLINIGDDIKLLKPTVIYINSIFSLNYSIKLIIGLFISNFKIKVILAPRGMLKESALKKKWLKKNLFLKIARWAGLYRSVLFHATNNVEKEEIKRYFPNSYIFVIDNLAPEIKSELESKEKKAKILKLVFVGRVHPIKNLHFIVDLLKLINFKVEFSIIGYIEDKEYFNALVNIINEYPSNITVSFKGGVEHKEISSNINTADLFVLPTLGENYGHAIIESLSVGRPVLISDQTPWKNLKDYNAGWELPLTDKQAWINAIEQAASWDQEEFDRHCEGALAYAKAHTNNEELVGKYVEMFSSS